MAAITTTITHGITLGTAGSYASPLTIAASGYIDNTGTSNAIYGPDTGPWTVVDYGRVVAQAGGGAGVGLNAGGRVSNEADGQIVGSVGVDIAGGGGTVTNYGTINGAGLGAGIYLGKGGSVVNGGLIEGTYNGIEVRRSPGTVTNSGTIAGKDLGGVGLYAGGTVINDSGGLISSALGLAIRYGTGAVINSGTIEGNPSTAAGIWFSQSGGTVTNNSGGLISGRDGVEIVNGATGTVINAGTITGAVHTASVAGVYFGAGGSVINNSGGVITGEYGVFIAARGTVVNGGTIVGSGGIAGVDIGAGGSVTNNFGGLIKGAGADGIDVASGASTVINAGTIAATGAGIVLSAGGTVTTSGTINGSSGTAVSFGGTGGNRLILDPGYHLGGTVVGSTSAGATNTLELGSAASTGTLSGLGTSIINFTAIQFDTGAGWLLGGNIAGLAAGTIGDFTIGDTIDLTGFAAVSETFSNNASLVLTDTLSNTVTLGIQGSFSTGSFAIGSDGGTGTDITVALSPPLPPPPPSPPAPPPPPPAPPPPAPPAPPPPPPSPPPPPAPPPPPPAPPPPAPPPPAPPPPAPPPPAPPPPMPGLSPVVLTDFSWAQGWGGPDNPRVVTDVNGDGTSDYVGFGDQYTFVTYGGTFSNGQGSDGPGFSGVTAAVKDFGSSEGYTAADQRGAAAAGVGAGDILYGQGYAGIYWYEATGETAETDAAGNTYQMLQYQSSPNLYGNFGSNQGWTSDNGFQILKTTSTDSSASILGFGDDGIVVGPDAFASGATASDSYVIPLAVGNDSGWKQSVDVRSFTDQSGKTIDLNGDGVADFVGMGPNGLVYAYGSDSGPGGAYELGALQTAHINGSDSDLGEAQGWTDATTVRDIVYDSKTGYDDIIAFGAAGVYVSMGQDPTTHNREPFGQLYLAMANFGSDQGWSVSGTPRLVGDVTGDGIPDIVGFGTSDTYVAVGSYDSSGNLQFAIDPTRTIADFGSAEGWNGSTEQTVRALGTVAGTGSVSSHSDLVLSDASNTQVWYFT
jgi:hypothetical protein